jgi:YgiT-type zinc finger domain-containing protein
MSNCSIRSCPGHYEARHITHMVKRGGSVVVLENVPAQVCDLCGDTLLPLSTVETIEAMLQDPGTPVRTVPVYEMPNTLSA